MGVLGILFCILCFYGLSVLVIIYNTYYRDHRKDGKEKILLINYINLIKNTNFDYYIDGQYYKSRDGKHYLNFISFCYEDKRYLFSFLDFLLVKIYFKLKKNKNILGYVERTDQEMIIMRALPGAGKSTRAKELVGNGIIHSTDDIMTEIGDGDYSKAFTMMIKDRPALGVAHRRNFFRVIDSMKKGLSPVIVDNTNIKRKDVKRYATEALKLGFKDENIKIIDLGLNGFTLEELVERNTHGVDLEVMTKFFNDYNNNNPVTLDYMFKKDK